MEERVMLSASPAAAAAALAPNPEADLQPQALSDLPDTAVLVADAEGDGVAAWAEQSPDGDWDVVGQRFDSLGTLLDEEFSVNSYTEGDQYNCAADMDSAGNLVLVWQSNGQDEDQGGIYAQRYGADGLAMGPEFRVNSNTAGDQHNPSVVMDESGNFLVAWTGQDKDGEGVFAQAFDDSGVRLGSEFRVNEITSGNQTLAGVEANPDGGYTVRWNVEGSTGTESAVYERQLDEKGIAQTGDIRLTSPEDDRVIALPVENADSPVGDPPAESLDVDYLSSEDNTDAPVTIDNLSGFAGNVAGWQNALTSDADLLFYGCDLAGSQNGQQLLQSLGALTGADVAASTDDTGHTLLGGDWDLEYTTGGIETHLAFTTAIQNDWFGVLGVAPVLDLDADDSSGQSGADFATTFTEDGGPVAISDGDAIVTDADSTNLESLTVTITNFLDGADEVLSANTSGTSIIANYNITNGILTLSGSDTVSNYQQVLRTLTYQNTCDNLDTTARTITFLANDGTDDSNLGTTTVTMIGQNDAAELDLDANNSSGETGANYAASFTEDGGAVLVVDGDATLYDVDSANFQSLTVRILNLLNGSSESLSADTTGTSISASYNSSSGILTLSGSDSVSNYQQVLRTVSYNNTAQNLNTSDRLITFVANDGSTNSNTGITTVSMTAQNDAPTLDLDQDDSSGESGADFATTFTEGGSAVLIADTDATLSDVDNANLQSLTVRITNLLDGASELLAADTSGTSISASYDSGTGELSLTGSDTKENYQQALRTITYDNASGDPDTTARSITFVANDGALDTNIGTTTVTLAAQNNPPSLDLDANNSSGATGADYATTFTEDGGPVTIADGDAVLTDADNPNLVSLTATITNLLDGSDETLTADTSGTSISASYDSNTGMLTLSGSDSAANYQQVLRTVSYDNTSDDPDTTDRVIEVVANDGTDDSVTATATISVVAQNDLPVANDDPGDYNSRILDLNPVSYWRLGEAVGPAAVDAGSASNNGTYSNVTMGQAGALGGDADTAADFNGSSSYVEIAHDDAYLLDDGAIQLWFHVDSLPSSTEGLFSKDSSGYDTGGHLTIMLDSDGTVDVRLQSASGDYYVESAATEAGAWHHVVFTFGSGGMELFVDGQLADTNAYTGGIATTSGDVGNYEPIALGASTQSSGDGTVSSLRDYFDGSLDEVAIFSSQVDAADVELLYLAGLDGYQVDEDGTLSVAADRGVLANDTDPEDTLTAVLDSGPSNAASFTLNADGSFEYTPDPDFDGIDTFTYHANDGTGDSNVATVTINVMSINDVPVLDLDADDSSGESGADYATSFTENGGAVAVVDTDATLADAEATTLESLEVTITNLLDGTAESLSANTSGTSISASYNSSNGVLSLSGTDTVDHYQQVLRTVTYNNTSEDPDTTERTITFVANDGTVDSNIGTTTLTMVAQNDAPILDLDSDNSSGETGADYATTFIEDDGPVAVADSDATLSDIDSPNLSSLTVTITNLQDGASELLSADTTGTSIAASYDNGTGVLTLTGADTVANYQQVLRTVTYDNSSDTPDGTGRTITFVANDGTTNSNTGTTTLSVVDRNDAPVLDLDDNNSSGESGADYATTFTEDGGPVAVADSDTTLSDADNANLSSAAVTITNLLDGTAESLAADTTGTSISASYDSGTGVLTLSGSDTVANYQQVLRTVTYNNTAQDLDATARTITFTVNDGADDSNTGTTTLSMVAQNDATVLDLDADDSSGESGADYATTFTEDGGPVSIADSDATLSDLDNTNLQSLTVTITNLLDGVSEALSADTTGTSIVASYDSGTGVLSLSGLDTLTNYQQVLRTVTYDNSDQGLDTTARTITCVANDGTDDSNVGTTTVSMVAQNDAPVLDLDADDSSGESGADYATTFNENGGPVLIADADASLTDADTANLSSLTVTLTNPVDGAGEVLSADTTGTSISASYDSGTGVLTLSGADSAANYQQVLRTVSYNNTAEPPDTTTRVVTFSANDGTLDSNLGTTTLTVLTQNDAPVLDLDANDSSGQSGADYATSFTENGGAVLIADSDATLSDVDSANFSSLTVTLTNLLDGTSEVLSADTTGTSITASYDSGTGILTLSGSDSVAAYQQVLRTVAYNNTSEKPNNHGALDYVRCQRRRGRFESRNHNLNDGRSERRTGARSRRQ